jgi:hypothetical protein
MERTKRWRAVHQSTIGPAYPCKSTIVASLASVDLLGWHGRRKTGALAHRHPKKERCLDGLEAFLKVFRCPSGSQKRPRIIFSECSCWKCGPMRLSARLAVHGVEAVTGLHQLTILLQVLASVLKSQNCMYLEQRRKSPLRRQL